MTLDLSEHMQSHIFWYGVYNRDLIALLNRTLKPGMVFIDVGANVGEITLAAAVRVGKTGKVISFEPVPELADKLSEHVQINALDNVTLCRVAVSDHPGDGMIYSPECLYSDGTDNQGMGTLFPTEKHQDARSRVSITTLDQFAEHSLAHVDVIKLDIEGGELAALRGAVSLLRDYGPALIVEISEDGCRGAGHSMTEVVEFLRQHGYSLFSIGRLGRLNPIRGNELAKSQNVYCVRSGGDQAS